MREAPTTKQTVTGFLKPKELSVMNPSKTNLAKERPDLAKEWDNRKNAPLKPCDVAPATEEKFWWKCRNGHSWKASPHHRVLKSEGCPYCCGKKVLIGYNDLVTTNPEIAKQWDCEKNGSLTPKDVSAGSSRRVWWKCKEGHSWPAPVKHRTAGSICPYCANRKLLSGFNDLETLYPDVAALWNTSKNGKLKPVNVMPGSARKVWWKCPEGHEWDRRINGQIENPTCPVCQSEIRKRKQEETNIHSTANASPNASSMIDFDATTDISFCIASDVATEIFNRAQPHVSNDAEKEQLRTCTQLLIHLIQIQQDARSKAQQQKLRKSLQKMFEESQSSDSNIPALVWDGINQQSLKENYSTEDVLSAIHFILAEDRGWNEESIRRYIQEATQDVGIVTLENVMKTLTNEVIISVMSQATGRPVWDVTMELTRLLGYLINTTRKEQKSKEGDADTMNKRGPNHNPFSTEDLKVFLPNMDILLPDITACAKLFAWIAKYEKIYKPELNVLNPISEIKKTFNIFSIEKSTRTKELMNTCNEEELAKKLMEMSGTSSPDFWYFVGALSKNDLRRVVMSQFPVEALTEGRVATLAEGRPLVRIGVKVTSKTDFNGVSHVEQPEATKDLELELKAEIIKKVLACGGTILKMDANPYGY